jgi:hypothetical protein
MLSQCEPMQSISSDVVLISIPNRKEIDEIVFEVDCQMISMKGGADIDIGQSSLPDAP